MKHQIPMDSAARADHPDEDKARHDGTQEVTPDLAYKRLMMVNVAFYGLPNAGACTMGSSPAPAWRGPVFYASIDTCITIHTTPPPRSSTPW